MTTDRQGKREKERERREREGKREQILPPSTQNTESDLRMMKCRIRRKKGEGGGRRVVTQRIVEEDKTKGVNARTAS